MDAPIYGINVQKSGLINSTKTQLINYYINI
ncbi:MAG: hypothetical protein ACJAYG_002733 [Oceanicoccus sp.]|jgi:hypothetical protein